MRTLLIRVGQIAAAVAALMLSAAGFAADEIHWTITGPTSVTFDWRGSVSETSIRYGLSAGSYSSTVTAVQPSGTCVPYSSAGPFYEAKLTGLAADTLYHYAIANGPDHTFRTPPPAGATSFDVLMAADIGDSSYYPTVTGVQQQMAQETSARFALMVGDLTYGDDHGQSHVDQHFNDVMAWSQDVAYMPAWGNHEWDSEPSDDLRNYKGRFDFPNPRTSVGTPQISNCGEDWYWFDYGNVRFIAYPEPWTGAWDDWNTQATSIMNDAQADPNITWIVTFGHRPAYSTGHHSGSTTLQSYLGGLAATHSKYVLNLNGHSHNYERSYPQNGSGDNLHGVVHVTVGTGGSSLETDGACLWLTCTQPSWSAVRYFHLGYLKLTFTPSAIQGSFICGPAGAGTNDITCTPGSVIDSFTVVASTPPSTVYVDGSNPQCSANGAGTPAQPLCTINQGVGRAVAGNTVIVKSGSYPEDIKLTKSGTSSQPIVVSAEPGANVVVSGQFRGFEISNKSWITIRGFTVSDTASYGIYVSSGSSNITIDGNHVSRAGLPISGQTKAGIYISGTSNSVVSGNTTDYNSDAGIAVVANSTNVTVTGNTSTHNARVYSRAAPGIDIRSGGNIVKDNICHDNEDSGIQVFGTGNPPVPSPNNLVVNNLCYANGDHGIDVSSAGPQLVIGNTVYGSTTAGINVEGPSGGCTLRNNISVDNAMSSQSTKGDIRVDPSSVPGTTIDSDLLFLSSPGTVIVWNGVSYTSLASFVAATGQEANGREAGPQWIGPSAGDFHLLPTSPAIDSADSGASGQQDSDLEGLPRIDDPSVTNSGIGPRPFDDRGAFEHPICGNGVKEGAESCDGTDTGIATCGQLGCTGGDPSCTAQCQLDFSTCTGCPVCGNGVKEYGEDCDGADLGGATCESLGQCTISGPLACKPDCHFNTSGCSCGDSAIESGCGEVCDGTNLAGQTCQSQGFGGGTLGCRSDCRAFQTSGCSICGNGIRQATEECDGSDLGGATCATHGCLAGTATCSASCTISYSGCSNCWGGTLYVDRNNPSCSDSGQGTATAPFCTINAAVSRVIAGGTVIVSSGTYPEYVRFLTSGTASAPITLKTAPGATVTVSGQLRGIELTNKNWITVDGFTVTSTTQYGIYVKTCTNVTIRNNHVNHVGQPSLNNTYPGIYVGDTTDSLVSGNVTEDNSDSGIYITGTSTNVTVSGNSSARNARGYTPAASGIEIRSPGNVIQGNVCHNNEDSGIVVQPYDGSHPAPNNLIVNNVSYLNGSHGIEVKTSQSQRIQGNTIYANSGSGIDLSLTSSQSTIANNISVDNAPNNLGTSGGDIRIDASSIPGTTIDFDLFYRSVPGTMISWNGVAYASRSSLTSATGQEPSGLQGAPLWVAPASADFRLQVGSPAIDSANSSLSGVQTRDIAGTARTDDPATPNTGVGPRNYDDRGAFEYPLDADHDGYASDEDCNDMNPDINPAQIDDSCDGIDQDCSGVADDHFTPYVTTCGVGACASTGMSSCVNHVFGDSCTPGSPSPEVGCDGIDNDCNPATPDVMDADGDTVTCATDCNDSDPSIYPNAPEINDGKDNQCPGNDGFGSIDEISGDSGFHTAGDKSKYSWTAQGGATSYQVARSTKPDFTTGCQDHELSGTVYTDSQNPTSGKVFYYVVRPLTPFVGSWGTRSTGAERTVGCASP